MSAVQECGGQEYVKLWVRFSPSILKFHFSADAVLVRNKCLVECAHLKHMLSGQIAYPVLLPA